MADITFIEKRLLERFLGMGGGYVLNFSDRTFQEFITDSVERDVDDPKYNWASGSKANRLRRFWEVEPNHVVGKLVRDLIAYAQSQSFEIASDAQLVQQCDAVAVRLLQAASVPEIEAITPNAQGRDFDALAKSVRDLIDKNQPEAGLDRLHTFLVKYVRSLCEKHNLPVDRSKPLHSLFGEYLKHLRNSGRLQSEMTERLLKSSIQNLDAFNYVRNNQSFAHDNELLNYPESLFIFNQITALIRFLRALEEPAAASMPSSPTAQSPVGEALSLQSNLFD